MATRLPRPKLQPRSLQQHGLVKIDGIVCRPDAIPWWEECHAPNETQKAQNAQNALDCVEQVADN